MKPRIGSTAGRTLPFAPANEAWLMWAMSFVLGAALREAYNAKLIAVLSSAQMASGLV